MMAEYIEREKLYEFLTEQLDKETGMYSKGRNNGINIARSALHNREITPSADVAPVVHGRWEFIGDDYANCSNCGTMFETRPTPYFFEANNKFCRNCGARMDGDGDEG